MGSDSFTGQFTGVATAQSKKPRIRLDADKADIEVGGDGIGGDLKLIDSDNVVKIRMDAGGVEPVVLEPVTKETILLSGKNGHVEIGGNDSNGVLRMRNTSKKTTVQLDAANATISAGNGGMPGTLSLETETGQTTVTLLGKTGWITAGTVALNDLNGERSVYLSGSSATMLLGGHGNNGAIQLFSSGTKSVVEVGAKERTFVLRNSNDKEIVRIEGFDVTPATPPGLVVTQSGRITVGDAAGKSTITLDGHRGNISLTGEVQFNNADCAEEFDLAPGEIATPGTVMVLDAEGRLRPSNSPYDTAVAGVLSGAGDYQPAMLLDKRSSRAGRAALALMGKIYCKADAKWGAISAGDLLTTSSTPGHAMKVVDCDKAAGCVIGKALRPLKSGQALIPILVTLQ